MFWYVLQILQFCGVSTLLGGPSSRMNVSLPRVIAASVKACSNLFATSPGLGAL